MPSSNLVLAPAIVAMVAELEPNSVLDVGPGCGKYGLLLREYVRRDLRIVAVEAERRYAHELPWVSCLYDDVWWENVTAMERAAFDGFDVVLMIDVLEHLSRDEGERLLQRIVPPVIVCTPASFFQNPEADDYPTERHRSVWTAAEIAALRPLMREDIDAQRIGGVLVTCAPLDE